MSKKKLLIIIITVLSSFTLLFWLIFIIISARRYEYVFDLKKAKIKNNEMLYYKDNGINYYTDSIEDITVSKLRFVFKTDKKSLKQIIKDKEFNNITSSLKVYKYQLGGGLETKYYNSDKTFVITRCEFYGRDDYEYHINDKYIKVECNRYNK